MGRNRFVTPAVVRLYLVDVHKRAHAALVARTTPKATVEELARSAAIVAEAEADGAWIDVKRELNIGEQRTIFASNVKTFESGAKAQLDAEQVGMSKVVAYLMAWSFVDDNGPVTLTPAAIKNLDVESFAEIWDAIEAHEEKQDKARLERKNAPDGATPTSPISPSVAS